MAWVRTSDQTARLLALRLAGKDAALLWFVLLHECAALNDGAGGDGVLTRIVIDDAAHLYSLNAKRLLPLLVEQGLLHTHETVKQCGPCMWEHGGELLKPGEHFMHEWWKRILLSKGKDDPIIANHDARRKALNNDKKLVDAIRSRDQDRCRYCGIPTADSSGANKKGKDVRQLDHVNPWGDNTLANVVVACRRCNSELKRQRTPKEAGMTLWSPGTTAEQIANGTAVPIEQDPTESDRAAGSNPADGRIGQVEEPDRDPAQRARPRETGRAGSAPDAGPDLAGSAPGSGLDGSGAPTVPGSGQAEAVA